MSGIIFNGIDSDNFPFLYFNKIGRPITAPIETKYIKVPGLKGAIFAGQEVDVLYIPMEVTVKGETAANVEQLKRSIAGWLKVKEPKPLIIKREPDKTYHAVLSESSDIDLIVATGKGQITFLCLDPIAEGLEREQVINALPAEFSRASEGYLEDGTKVASGQPRYERGYFHNLLTDNRASVEIGSTVGFEVYRTSVEISTDNTTAWEGEYSLKTVVSNANNEGFFVHSGILGKTTDVFTWSIYVKGTGAWRFQMYRDGQTAMDTKYVTLSNEWQRVVLTGTPDINGQIRLYVRTHGQQTATCYADGLQLEYGDTAKEWVLPSEGKALMVEEGTTNILPAGSDDFQTGWTAYQNALVTVTSGRSDPFGGTSAYRIQTSGGDALNKYYVNQGPSVDGKNYAYSVWVRVNTSTDVRVYENPGVTSAIVTQADGWKRVELNSVGNGTGAVQLQFRAINIADPLDFDVIYPMIEEKAYVTSYVEPQGTRSNEVVTVPTEGVLSAEKGTIDFLININDALVKDLDNASYIFSMRKPGTPIRFYVTHSNATNEIRFNVTDENGNNKFVGFPTPEYGWHRITVRWKKSQEMALFLNGQKMTSSNSAPIPTFGDNILYIGSFLGNDQFANTVIDDLRFSLVARTDEEIAAYDLTKPLPVDEYTTAKYSFNGTLNSFEGVVVENGGTDEAYPLYEIDVKRSTTLLAIVGPEDSIILGKPYDAVDQEPFERETSVLKDDCSTLVGWTHLPGGMFLETNMVGGEMGVRGGWAFEPVSYGTNANGWVGPAIKKSLPEPVQDFRISVDLSMYNQWGDAGKIVLYLMDEASNIVGYLAMMDTSTMYEMNTGVIRIGPPVAQGGNQVINYTGDVPGVWNRFRGILRLERVGENITAYIGKIREDGTHHARHTRRYKDTAKIYQTPVAQVCVYIGKAKNYEPCVMHMNDISVWKINDPADYQIPYIAHAGDKITIDTNIGEIRKNGDLFQGKGVLDPASNWFTLDPGGTALTAFPHDAAVVKTRFRERWF